MKRSNIIFIILIATLFVAPFITLGIYSLLPGEPTLDLPMFRTVQINNPSLEAKDVHVESNNGPEPLIIIARPFFRNRADNNHVRYEGRETYLPDLSHRDDTLYVGAPQNAGNDTSLTLHIRIYGLEKVELNGAGIWEK